MWRVERPIELTDWARDILRRSQEAARRFNPDARIRLARTVTGVETVLTDAPDPDDVEVRDGGVTIYVEQGLTGLLDVEEPHDRLVLRSPDSIPNAREHH